MQEQHVDDLLDAYALGGLEPAEVDAVERHLQGCASCRALAIRARSVTDLLLTTVPQVTPPPALRGRLMARIAAEAQASRPAIQPSQAAASITNGAHPEPADQGWSIGKMLRSILGGGAEEDSHAGAVLQALLAEPDTLIWSVGATDAAPGASARLIGSRTRRDAVLVTNGLRAPAVGEGYQVWFLSNGKPVPNAVFMVDRAGQGASVLRASEPLDRYDTVAVTPEPLGGSRSPTGPIVLAGALA